MTKAAVQDRTTRSYEQLKELIVDGRLAPGSRIIESDVARRLGVSRTPIRASLQRLEQEGFILRGGDGQQWRPTVAPLTRDDAVGLFEITGHLEGLAARWACTLPEARRSRMLADLRKRNEALLELAESGEQDHMRYYRGDVAFHRTYLEAAAGPKLLAVHDSLRSQVERYARVYTSLLPDRISTSYQEHARIVEALERGDQDASQAAVEQNWRGAAARLGPVIDHIGERGSW
ncbi:MAG: GntR family transcriptional regulator [Gemmatimonadetes bacterium]|nr:GntR family transcriptional regulator [Gemmatimonadota bacterium]